MSYLDKERISGSLPVYTEKEKKGASRSTNILNKLKNSNIIYDKYHIF